MSNADAAPDAPDRTALRADILSGSRRRPIVLVGLMGAGKTTIGKRLAARLRLPFRDADAEIERAAGCSIAEMFERWGEAAFREGERRVIRRLLDGEPLVLATGGGAYMDPHTQAVIKARATSVWLRCPLEVLAQRVAGRHHRPLLADRDPVEVLRQLMTIRHPIYAKADLVIDCDNGTTEHTTRSVLDALAAHAAAQHLHEPGLHETGSHALTRVRVPLRERPYDILIGRGLIARAGEVLAPLLPQPRAMIVTDETVAALHLPALQAALAAAGIAATAVIVPPGEHSKSLRGFGEVTDGLLASGPERRCSVIALGGGVVGDLAGFAAASVMRGLPFIQIPTTLLSQVDSSVGGKTGINTSFGKNLLGAFHQPLAVLVDTAALDTLPPRERRAGYAEIVKAGLIGDAALFRWCLQNGSAIVSGSDSAVQAEAIRRACLFKATVVADDEREERASGGRALLNLGHTFAHALEAELHYDGRLLHGEAVAVGLGLAIRLSARLGHCDPALADQVVLHLESLGMHGRIASLVEALGIALEADRLVSHMRRDKKLRDGRIGFVLLRGAGAAFSSRDVAAWEIKDLLLSEGCIG